MVTKSVTGILNSTSKASIAVENSSGEIVTLIVTERARIGTGCLTVGRKVAVIYVAKDKNVKTVRCK